MYICVCVNMFLLINCILQSAIYTEQVSKYTHALNDQQLFIIYIFLKYKPTKYICIHLILSLEIVVLTKQKLEIPLLLGKSIR